MLVLSTVASRFSSVALWEEVIVWLMWMMQSMVTSGLASTRLQHKNKFTRSSSTLRNGLLRMCHNADDRQ